jgi:hypothetical protein
MIDYRKVVDLVGMLDASEGEASNAGKALHTMSKRAGSPVYEMLETDGYKNALQEKFNPECLKGGNEVERLRSEALTLRKQHEDRLKHCPYCYTDNLLRSIPGQARALRQKLTHGWNGILESLRVQG